MSFCKFPYSALGKSRQSEKKERFCFGTQQEKALLQKRGNMTVECEQV
jgi:hypothetical protein